MNPKTSTHSTGDAILDLYNLVTGKNETDYRAIRKRFLDLKISEPMIQLCEIHGKIPQEDHILKPDEWESPFLLNPQP